MSHHTQKHTHNSFIHWIISHVRALNVALGEFKRTPIVSFITVCVISISIILPLGFFVLLENLQYVNASWDASAPTISLYLKANISDAQRNALITQLHANAHIAQVTYVSQEQGLKAFEKNTPFSDAIKLFQQNPIPSVVVVLPTLSNQKPSAIHALYLSLKQLPQVEIAQLDMNWVNRLYEAILIGKRITNALSILFGFGVILIIGHTLRASLSSHAKEIQVLKLMGATNAYIRRPLLYHGVLYGLFGGLVAWAFINIFLLRLQPPVSQLALTYRTTFQLQTISFSLGCFVLFISILLGLISACLITTQFLNHPEQTD